MSYTRRTILKATVGGLAVAQMPAFAKEDKSRPELTGKLGITTGSFMRQLREDPKQRKFRLLDLPKIMNQELNLNVIDLMTATLASFENNYLDNNGSDLAKPW